MSSSGCGGAGVYQYLGPALVSLNHSVSGLVCDSGPGLFGVVVDSGPGLLVVVVVVVDSGPDLYVFIVVDIGLDL